MASPTFYSQAGNFISSVQGGVDPRTGLFNVSLPLVNLHSGRFAGPALALSLQYSPLISVNEGFGKGFTLNLTRYDTATGKLVLSSGEEYRISSSGTTVKQKKLNNFLFKKTDNNTYQITHKSGLTEHLSLRKSVYVPTRITAPDGRGLTLTWSSAYTPARLTRVMDDDGTVLCSVTYPGQAIATTQLSLLPNDTAAGYSMVFKFTNELLVQVTSHADNPALVWTFDYDDVGPKKNYRAITGLIWATGLKEKVAYYTDTGMKFPENAGLPDLPCVYKHTITPGGGQPQSVTQWTWTQKNYLGKDAGLNQWQPDTDSMLNILLKNYLYGSTAKVMDTDGSTVISTVTRSYNSYHLQVSETTLRGGKTYSETTEYHAKSGAAFADQPAQYALPVSHTESWDDGRGASRKRIMRTQFDESGNPLRQESPDGTITEYEYYPAKGEGNVCPADPYGFVRWLKRKTVTPSSVQGDEPAFTTINTWKKQSALSGGGYAVVADTETQTIGNTRTVVTREYYNNANDTLTYARDRARSTVLIPDVGTGNSFTSRQDFSYQSSSQGIRQSETFTGHDGLTTTRSTLRHASLGHLLSQTDAQGVTVTHTYDKAGRVLTRTIASGTNYKNTASWSYAIETDGPVTTETDASGNKLKTHFDRVGRIIRQQRLDQDNTQRWFEVFSRTYNTLGEVASGAGSDWLTASSQAYRVEMTASHDGWGAVNAQTFSDGTKSLQETNPLALLRTLHMQGSTDGQSLSSGKTTTTYDARSNLPLTEVLVGTAGQPEGTRSYTWDGLGRMRKETDERGNATKRTYDAYNRVLTQTLPDGSKVTRTYAPHLTGDNIASISVTGPDAGGQTKTWLMGTQMFDSLGRVTKQVSGGRATTYAYDGTSPVPSVVTLPSGKKLAYQYIPELGNQVSSMNSDGVAQTFRYDAKTGDLLTAQEGDTKNDNIWGSSGNLNEETFKQVGTTRKASYSRTLAGDIAISTDITGKRTRYTRDETGRVTAINDDALTVSIKYDALGRLSQQAVRDASAKATLITALAYDDFGQEVTRTLTDNSGVTITVSQAWLLNGLLDTRTTQQNSTVLRREQYDYDTRNRLTGYKVSGSSLPPDAYGHKMVEQIYRYDALNNLTTVTTTLADGGSDTATYHYKNTSDPTQLTSVTHTHAGYPQNIGLQYDANGRMTQDEAGRTLGYDVTGRLVSVSGQGISGGRYGYDALNRLVSQNVSDGDTRQLYYRADELVNEVLTQQSRETRWIKSGHTTLGVSEGAGLTLTAGDQHDSLLWSRDISQKNGEHHVWSPYGNGKPTDLLPGYNGERADPVSGTYHLGNGYRAYNPVLMRFNCPDNLSPFGAGGINPYAYCAGDPVNYTDPSGHISWQGIVGIVAGAIGLAFSVFTAGASIAAAGGVMAALGAASTTSLVIGGLSVVADVTAIASGAAEDSNPQASSVLGWVSMATGLAGLAAAGIGQVPKGIKAVRRGLRGSDLRNTEPAYYKTFHLEQNYIVGSDGAVSNFNMRLGFTNNFSNTGEPGVMVHGSKKGYIYLADGFEFAGSVEPTPQEISLFPQEYFFSVPEFVDFVKQRHSIDLATVGGDKPLHFVSCFSGTPRPELGGISMAQQLANVTGRRVYTYGAVGETVALRNGYKMEGMVRIFKRRAIFETAAGNKITPKLLYPQ